jgi:RNA 2',3'-cyclic 3'-phosphodiesterase
MAGHPVRLFIAIDPPPDVLDDLADFIARLGVVKAGVRVTGRHLWHVTLAFLGELPDQRLPAAISALDGAVPDQERPVLRIAGGGRFGRGKFTVLWAGIEGDLRPLRLAVGKQLRRVRLPYDTKRFHPHLTIARPGDRLPQDDVDADVATLSTYQGTPWTVESITLMRSHLGPKPVYEPLHVAPLG